MKKYNSLFYLLSFSLITVGLSACTTTPHAEKRSSITKHFLPVRKETNSINVHKSNKPEGKKVTINSPSNGQYPNINPKDPIWIDVSTNDQRVYIKNGQKTLSTMVVSTGINTKPDNSTPNGTFYIQQERGEWFYSPSYKEGAEYWVSWKNHGEFLFHSVPMNRDKQVILSEAEKLGKKASHGCNRLTISDAKWIYNNIHTGTKVVIRS